MESRIHGLWLDTLSRNTFDSSKLTYLLVNPLLDQIENTRFRKLPNECADWPPDSSFSKTKAFEKSPPVLAPFEVRRIGGLSLHLGGGFRVRRSPSDRELGIRQKSDDRFAHVWPRNEQSLPKNGPGMNSLFEEFSNRCSNRRIERLLFQKKAQQTTNFDRFHDGYYWYFHQFTNRYTFLHTGVRSFVRPDRAPAWNTKCCSSVASTVHFQVCLAFSNLCGVYECTQGQLSNRYRESAVEGQHSIFHATTHHLQRKFSAKTFNCVHHAFSKSAVADALNPARRPGAGSFNIISFVRRRVKDYKITN